MKKVLFVNENDFENPEDNSISSLKKEISILERQYDDIFAVVKRKTLCLKARNSFSGEYDNTQLAEYPKSEI